MYFLATMTETFSFALIELRRFEVRFFVPRTSLILDTYSKWQTLWTHKMKNFSMLKI